MIIKDLGVKYNAQHFIYNKEFVLVDSFDLHNFEIAVAPEKNLNSLKLIASIKATTDFELFAQVKNILDRRK